MTEAIYYLSKNVTAKRAYRLSSGHYPWMLMLIDSISSSVDSEISESYLYFFELSQEFFFHDHHRYNIR